MMRGVTGRFNFKSQISNFRLPSFRASFARLIQTKAARAEALAGQARALPICAGGHVAGMFFTGIQRSGNGFSGVHPIIAGLKRSAALARNFVGRLNQSLVTSAATNF
jgi:hypothetical protein